MKKVLIVILAVALTLSMWALVTGCGSDENKTQAKQYMTDGDAYWAASKAEWENVAQQESQIMTKIMSGDTAFLQGAGGDAVMLQFQASFKTIDQNDKAAYQQYKSIMDLDDVQDYKDYAVMMMEVLDLDQQRLLASEALLEGTKAYLQSLPPGTQPNLQQLASNPDFQKITDLGDQIESLEASADQLRTDKKL